MMKTVKEIKPELLDEFEGFGPQEADIPVERTSGWRLYRR